MRRFVNILAVLAIVLIAQACTTTPIDPTANWSARKLYNEATRALGKGEFVQAVDYFEILESRYPFGSYTLQAQLDIAYAHYKRREYLTAIDSVDRFIRLHPRNPNIDYAYYLKGMANFSRGEGLFTNFTGRDPSKRYTQVLALAFADFDTLIRRFPDSRYIPDARQRMVYLRNELAEHELEIAEFYYSRGAVLATINRIRYMLENYDGARRIPDGLALMAQAYRDMGLNELADDTLRVLALNQPSHPALTTD